MRILYFTRNWTTHDQRFLRAMVAGGHDVWLLRWENAGHPLREGELPAGVREALWEEASLSNLEGVLARVRPSLLHAGPVHTCGYLAALSGFHFRAKDRHLSHGPGECAIAPGTGRD